MKKKVLKIGIVGCGAIGSSLAKAICRDFRGRAVLAGLYDIDPARPRQLEERLKVKAACASLAGLVGRSDLVVEASSARVSADIARACCRRGVSVMVMSVGGLVGKTGALQALCRRTGARLYVPSGAIAGIDAVKAARFSGIRSAVLRTTKHPKSFAGVEYVRRKGVDLNAVKRPTLLFSGSAAQAVKHFPQNINVAAVLSLAGLGAQKTTVEIIASPLATKNIHEIIIESASARISTRTENSLHPENPKTSYLAVLSAVAMLERIIEPIGIGT